MKDLQGIAFVLGTYAVNHNGTYPNVNSIETLIPILIPVISSVDLPAKDAWGNRLRYVAWRENPSSSGPDSFIIASPGKDGIWEKQDLRAYTQRKIVSFNEDIVIKNGQLLSIF